MDTHSKRSWARIMAMMAMSNASAEDSLSDEEFQVFWNKPYSEWTETVRNKMRKFMGEMVKSADELPQDPTPEQSPSPTKQ